MKTYFSFSVLVVLLCIVGCSKSDTSADESQQSKTVNVDYTVLLNKDNFITTQFLSSEEQALTFSAENSNLPENIIPDLSILSGSDYIQFHEDGTCGGKITSHNFDTDTTTELDPFLDFKECNITTTAIAESDNSLFISYELTSDEASTYFVRILDLGAEIFSPIDISMSEKPVGLAVANNRLFIVTLDALNSGDNNLVVIAISTQAVIHEKGLGDSVDRIFTNVQDNIIVSYNDLHTTVNSSTLSFEYTQYNLSLVTPSFSTSVSANFDDTGKLYYPIQSGEYSTYDLVPAIYDFSNNLVVLYAYENFLTEAKREFEYEIKTTSVVAYDEENGFMLVGYEKLNTAFKSGGILRIKLAPEPELIDNIDLDGVPHEIIIN